MKRLLFFMSFSALITSAYAQPEIKSYGDYPKPGDRIQGVVRDSVGPIHAVIKEMNYKNNEVAYVFADMYGNFSLRIANPSDSIEVSTIGYYTIQFPISRDHYDIVLQRNPETYKYRSDEVHDRTGFITDDIHPLLYLNNITQKTQHANWDGFDYSKETYNEKEIAHLLGIEVDSIIKVEVLKGKAATKKWGSRAKNGSIEVWTK